MVDYNAMRCNKTPIDSDVRPNATDPTVVILPGDREGTKPLIGKPVEAVSVQRIEVSLADETIRKFARELAIQFKAVGVFR